MNSVSSNVQQQKNQTMCNNNYLNQNIHCTSIKLGKEMVNMSKRDDNPTKREVKLLACYLEITCISFVFLHSFFCVTVAITACSVSKDENSGYILPFDNVKTSIGINNISYFKSSGKFKCEYGGLYTVSVSLTVYNTLINYGLYLNGKEYTAVYELNNKVSFQRGTTSVVVNLRPNDMLWVQFNDLMYVHERNSCIAIVMIK